MATYLSSSKYSRKASKTAGEVRRNLCMTFSYVSYMDTSVS